MQKRWKVWEFKYGFSHVPVLYEEAMEYLNIRPDGIYADGTLGGAGHSQGICGRLDERGTLIGIDRDSEAISAAKERLRGFPCRCLFVHSNYSDIKKILRECGVGRIDGALLDLGVSSTSSIRRNGVFLICSPHLSI